MRMYLVGVWAAVAASAAPVAAQDVRLPGRLAPGAAIGFGAEGTSWTPVTPATPLPVADRQESFALVVANSSAAPATVYGGRYVVTQNCASYGTVSVRYRGPDGVAMATLFARTAADAGGGTLVTLGSNAVVDATVADATGCNVSLSRVP